MKFLVIRKSGIIKGIFLTCMLAVMLFLTGYSGSYSIYTGKLIKKAPICSVETEEKVVALSFDAAWGAEQNLKILKTLEDYDIKASFFVVGFWAGEHRDELKQLTDSGRVEIGTRSNTNPHMGRMSKSQIKLELETSKSIIENVIGEKVDLFRAPFGEYSDTLLTTADELGFYTIQCDVGSLAWKDISAGELSAKMISKVKNGSIVLMHNDGKYTVDALPLIIEGLKQRGYSFVTIGNLILRENYTIDYNGRQIRSN